MAALPRPCQICGLEFTPDRHNHNARFCSKSCVWKGTRGPEFNKRIARESRNKRSESQRGRGEGRTYRKLNGRHEHRVVAEKQIGRALQPGEVVHHKDGNKLNNHPENLVVLTQAEHMRKHGLGIPGMNLYWRPWEGKRKI